MVEQIHALALDDFIRLYNEDGPLEFINGEVITLIPGQFMHGETVRLLSEALIAHIVSPRTGYAYVEVPYVMLDKADWVRGSRVPDLMFFQADRLEAWRAENAGQLTPITIVPDLAIEVVSPTDSYTELQAKVDGSLQDGVELVWVVYPQRKTVTVYTPTEHRALAGGDHLTAPDLLPGFSLSVDTLFGE